MRCDQIERLLYLYQDGELGEKEKKEMEEHIKECPNCSKKLADLKLIRAEVKNKNVPQPPETYWESFAQRVREKIGRKTKVSFGQRFSHFLKTVFSYSPAEIKWATAVASVVLLFVVVKLFVSYEKMNVTTIQQETKVERTTTSREEIPNVEVKTPEKKKGIVLEKEVPKTIRAPLENVTISKGLESETPTGKMGVQKETAIGERSTPDKDETVLKKLSTTTPKLEEKEEGYMAVQAPKIHISGTPVITSAEKPELQADIAAIGGDTLKQGELVRESIDKWRKFTEDEPKGEERDKGYLNMAWGYMKLYDVARNKEETLKEAIDSVRVYIDSTITSAYKDSINDILLELESVHKK